MDTGGRRGVVALKESENGVEVVAGQADLLEVVGAWMRAAASRTFCTAGNSNPIRMAMMAITTSSSISVKASRRREMRFI